MKFPTLKAPIAVNILITLFSGFVSFFGLVFGIAHMFGEPNPNIPRSEHIKGVIAVATLCVLGVAFLIITIASLRGIFQKLKERKER
ncbi:hypothetical protein [Aegicerativicinus sediminis]|uniref:hypothetical protein n=1 Tax=Aegicerativicinus sediminis TaxID=2893202 RepID=UPI001E3500E0|nr:hypothetical protein [Aegicerativicinus sediminis]